MIRFKIKEYLQSMGATHPNLWLIKNCGFSRGKAFRIINSQQDSISLVDIAKLIKALKCTPNEFFYWQQTPGNTLPADHPALTQLLPPDGLEDWQTIFKKLSPEKIAKLRNTALGEINDQPVK